MTNSETSLVISSAQEELQLQRDVDNIKKANANTQEIYREVCALLFFKYSITPTANKLYQLVRKGSMSAPVNALTEFWKTLRARSKVQIECPDLPDEIKVAAGELVSSLWLGAQERANGNLEALRAETLAQVEEARTQVASAQRETDLTLQQLAVARDEIAAAQDVNASLQRQLDTASGHLTELSRQLDAARQETAAEHQALVTLEQTYRENLEKLRSQMQKESDRLRDAEKRALLEIDRERTVTTKLQKELDAARALAQKEYDQYKTEIKGHLAALGDAKQQLGKLEGTIQALTAERDGLATRSADTQAQLLVLTEKMAGLEVQCEVAKQVNLHQATEVNAANDRAIDWQTKCEAALSELERLRQRVSEPSQ